MMAERSVLGWAAAGVDCGTDVARVGAVEVLLHRAGDTARARLKAQADCFAQGVNFVPTAPALDLSETVGKSIADQHQQQILTDIDSLKNRGQMYLTLQWSQPDDPPIDETTGRTWLLARALRVKAAQRAEDRARATMERLIEGLAPAEMQSMRGGLGATLLVHRKRVQPLCDTLRAIGSSLEGHDLKLTLSGLWPPFSFVQPFQDRRERTP